MAEIGKDDVRVDGLGVGPEEDVRRLDVAVANAFSLSIRAAGIEAGVEEGESGKELSVYVPDERFGQ